VFALMRRLAAAALAAGLLVALGACGGSSGPSAGVDVSVFHLKIGECIIPPTSIQAELSSLKVVACKEPHTQEVFAMVDDSAAGDNYPGDTALRNFADGQCLQRFQGYVGVAYRYSSLFYTYLLPSVRSWAAKDRTVVCVVTTTGQQLTSSVKGSRR
jgi:Septum formation